MGLSFQLKLYRDIQTDCELHSVLVHSDEDQHRIPIANFETGSKEAFLEIEALPIQQKRIQVEVEFSRCESIQSKEFVANRGDIFYVRIGDNSVDVVLRAAGAWI